jgi:hypothetical protein
LGQARQEQEPTSEKKPVVDDAQQAASASADHAVAVANPILERQLAQLAAEDQIRQ